MRNKVIFFLGLLKEVTEILNPSQTPDVKASVGETPNRYSSGKNNPKQGRYANVFQIGHNEFEFMLEFGQQDHGIHTRIYLSPQYARMLSELVIDTLREYDRVSGAKVTDTRPN